MNLGRLISADVPDLTEDEATDLVLLRKEYGISAREAWCDLPAWEVHLLLSAAKPVEFQEVADDPFEQPPDDLKRLFSKD